MFSVDADLFFKSPADAPIPPFGILYALRREIRSCLGLDSGASCPKTLWAGGMAILAGIDLLAKFLAGDDATGGVGKRFREFVKRYFHVSAGDEDVIYQLRNALLHSFGLYSMTPAGKVYRFRLSAQSARPLIEQINTDSYQIDLLTLHGKFETAVAEFAVDLDRDPALQSSFGKLYPNYGWFTLLPIAQP